MPIAGKKPQELANKNDGVYDINNEGKQKAPPSSQVAALIPIKATSQTTEEAAQRPSAEATTQSDHPELEALLSTIQAIQPKVVDTMAITWKGANVWDVEAMDELNCPFVLYWKNRGSGNQNVIDDGSGNDSCDNWQVFNKNTELGKAIMKDLKILQDDTKKGPYITNGKAILCIARTKNYKENHLKKRMRSYKSHKDEEERRVHIGKSIADTDVDGAMQLMQAVNNGDDVQKADWDREFQALKESGGVRADINEL